MDANPKKRKLPVGTLILLAVWVTATALIVAYLLPAKPKVSPDLQGVVRPFTTTITPFELVKQAEQPFTLRQLKGQWTFLFFGYTYCPDICPGTMTVLSRLKHRLRSTPDGGSRENVVFISVDPERDTPAVLSAYLSYFGDDFVGATGPEKDLAPFAKQFGAMYSRELSGTSGSYLMSHTSSIFLLSPKAEWVATFSPPHDAETIATQYAEIRESL